MELRIVDPKILKANPNNPRGKLPRGPEDEQMEASVRERGVLQPLAVRQRGEDLVVRWGDRRRAAAVAVGLTRIPVIVLGPEDPEDEDDIRAGIENLVRKDMTPADTWRFIDKLLSGETPYTEEAIALTLNISVRKVRQYRLLGKLHKPMLDRIHQGDMPNVHELATIASAPAEEQAEIWKKHKPKKNESVAWWQISQALARTKLPASAAKFDGEHAEKFGVVYTEDLFAPADKDSRSTTNVEGFLAAQQAWLEENLPENGTVLKCDRYGRGELPPKATEHWGKADAPGVKVGHWIDPRTGEVRTQAYKEAAPVARGKGGTGAVEAAPKATRADITQKGVAMIGDMRTDALHAALRTEAVDDLGLISLLVLALGGKNVSIRSGATDAAYHRTLGGASEAAHRILDGDTVVTDPDTVRAAAREALVHTLSCRADDSDSGAVARVAGAWIGAGNHLPNMGTPEFLACLSKAATEEAARSLGLTPAPTGKATREAMLRHAGGGHYVHPAAGFGLTEREIADLRDGRRRDEERRKRLASAAVSLPDEGVEGFDGFEDAGAMGTADTPNHTDGPETDETGDFGGSDDAARANAPAYDTDDGPRAAAA